MFTSKKIVLSILAVSLIVPASVFAGNRSRWEQFVKRVEPYGKYIVPASLSIGAAAGLTYLAIPNNQSLREKYLQQLQCQFYRHLQASQHSA